MRKDAPIISCFHLDLFDASRNRKALDDVTIEIERGAWVETVGPAGGGKTLLFSVLSLRAAAPKKTKVVVAGRNMDKLPVSEVAEMRRMFGSACSAPILLDDRTVIENLVVPFVVRGEARLALEACEALLEKCELMGLRDICVRELSQQERTAVGVLRAMVGRPKCILIDGALDALEPRLLKPIMAELKQCHLDGAAVVLFGREYTENARRGRRYRLETGVLTEVENPVIVPPAEVGGVR
jgi:ABC-type ATPase involved in cell division